MSTLSTRLKELRSKLGVKQSQLAQIMGAGEATVKAMEQGRTLSIKGKYTIALEDKLKINRVWLEHGRGDMFKTEYGAVLSSIAKIDSALNSDAMSLPYYEDIKDTNYVSNISMSIGILNNPSRTLLAIKINDDGMKGVIEQGDMVFVNMDDTELVSGKIYKIEFNNEVMLKRAYKTNSSNQFILKSDNQNYPELTVEEKDFKVFGRVVATIKINLL